MSQSSGLDAFQAHEREKALQPLPAGPLKPFLTALHRLQHSQHQDVPEMRIRTALVTARGAPAHERALQTLMSWRIAVDEAMFLGGLPKGEFLREFEPDFFFDDQTGHVSAAAIHGNKSQGQRMRALSDFKAGKVKVLVATDIAARGIDIDQLPRVINFDLPMVAEDYVHRIGRTGRAGASGLAVTLVSGSDARLVGDIEKLIKKKIELEAIEYDDDRPKERINDGRRAWREGADSNDPRSAGSAHRREAREPREPREGREPRDYRGFRPAAVSRDPFFAKPYEPSVSDAAPAWEAAAKVPARSGISANIKPKRKVAALFKAPETTAS